MAVGGGKEQRRDPRYPYRMTVDVRVGTVTQTVTTENIGAGGMFMRVPQPPPLRELFWMRLHGAPGDTIETHGRAVHVVPATWLCDTPGVGVEFYGMDTLQRKWWDALIRRVATGGAPPK